MWSVYVIVASIRLFYTKFLNINILSKTKLWFVISKQFLDSRPEDYFSFWTLNVPPTKQLSKFLWMVSFVEVVTSNTPRDFIWLLSGGVQAD